MWILGGCLFSILSVLSLVGALVHSLVSFNFIGGSFGAVVELPAVPTYVFMISLDFLRSLLLGS